MSREKGRIDAYSKMLAHFEEEKRPLLVKTPISVSPTISKDRQALLKNAWLDFYYDEYESYQKDGERIEELVYELKHLTGENKSDLAPYFVRRVKELKLKQLEYFYKNEDLLIGRKRTTGFFIISAHGKFAELENEDGSDNESEFYPFPLPPKQRLYYPAFDNEATFFFRLPPKVRLFFPTLGQDCLSVSTCDSEPKLWKKLATSRSNLFFENPDMETNRDIRQLLEATRLYTEGDLFPNFLLRFDLCDIFDVFSITTNPKAQGSLSLETNAWAIPSQEPLVDSRQTPTSTEQLDINKDLVYTLGEVVEFLNTKVPRPEGQVLDIVLQCCNPHFVNKKNKKLEKRTRARWQVLLDEGKRKMMEARKSQATSLTHEQGAKLKSPLTSTSSWEGGDDPMFKFQNQESKELQHQRSAPSDRKKLFTKSNCICISPCKGGKCTTEPALCHNKSEDNCVFQEARPPKKEAEGISSPDTPSPKKAQG